MAILRAIFWCCFSHITLSNKSAALAARGTVKQFKTIDKQIKNNWMSVWNKLCKKKILFVKRHGIKLAIEKQFVIFTVEIVRSL